MTHEELRSLVGLYASATLVEPAAGAVRAHLATGCPECLNEFYHHPVGLPRGPGPVTRAPPIPSAPTPAAPPAPVAIATAAAPAAPVPAAPLTPVERSRGARLLSATLAAVALVLALAFVWSIGQLRGREAAHREAVAELAARAAVAEAQRAQVEAQRAQIAARLEAAERELAAVRAASAKQSEEVAAATAARLEQLEQDLAAARARIEVLARGIERREADIARLEAAVHESRTLRELLATPGAQLLRLEPSAPFRAPRGHVLWNPARPILMLYAFGLPRLPEGVSYRLRLVMEGEGGATQPVLSPDRAGEIVLPVRLDDTPARLRQVEIVRDPPGEAVLSGRVAPPAS